MLLQVRIIFLFLLCFLLPFFSLSAKDKPITHSGLHNKVETGKLSVVIESFAAKNIKFASQVAKKVEIWIGNRCVGRLTKDSNAVTLDKGMRFFSFPLIELKTGYYFITVRLYKRGWVSGKTKYEKKTFQVGIHSGKITKIYKKIPIFLW